MMFPNKEHVELVRLAFPRGAQVVCISIDDPYVTIPLAQSGK